MYHRRSQSCSSVGLLYVAERIWTNCLLLDKMLQYEFHEVEFPDLESLQIYFKFGSLVAFLELLQLNKEDPDMQDVISFSLKYVICQKIFH